MNKIRFSLLRSYEIKFHLFFDILWWHNKNRVSYNNYTWCLATAAATAEGFIMMAILLHCLTDCYCFNASLQMSTRRKISCDTEVVSGVQSFLMSQSPDFLREAQSGDFCSQSRRWLFTFLQTTWLMFFPVFLNTKIICCGLVINWFKYQFRETVLKETVSKQSILLSVVGINRRHYTRIQVNFGHHRPWQWYHHTAQSLHLVCHYTVCGYCLWVLTDNQVVNVDSVEMILTVSRMETDTVILWVSRLALSRDWQTGTVRPWVRLCAVTHTTVVHTDSDT